MADDLTFIVDAAIALWQEAGISDGQAELLRGVTYQIADLSGPYLGLATHDTITIDADAAGHGWYIDATPLDASEFSDPKSQISDFKSQDLLTTVLHEMGHVLGLEDLLDDSSVGDIMHGWLEAGTRRTPDEAAVDRVFAALDDQ